MNRGRSFFRSLTQELSSPSLEQLPNDGSSGEGSCGGSGAAEESTTPTEGTQEPCSRLLRQASKGVDGGARMGVGAILRKLGGLHGLHMPTEPAPRARAASDDEEEVSTEDARGEVLGQHEVVGRLLRLNTVVAEAEEWLFGGYSTKEVLYDMASHVASHSFSKRVAAEGSTLHRLLASLLLCNRPAVSDPATKSLHASLAMFSMQILCNDTVGESGGSAAASVEAALQRARMEELLRYSSKSSMQAVPADTVGRERTGGEIVVVLSAQYPSPGAQRGEGTKKREKREKRGKRETAEEKGRRDSSAANLGEGHGFEAVLCAQGNDDQVLSRCSHVLVEGEAIPLTDEARQQLLADKKVQAVSEFVNFVAEKRVQGRLLSTPAKRGQVDWQRADFVLKVEVEDVDAPQGRGGLISASQMELCTVAVEVSSQVLRSGWASLWAAPDEISPEEEVLDVLTHGWTLLGTTNSIATLRRSTVPYLPSIRSPNPDSMQEQMTTVLVSQHSASHVGCMLEQLCNFHAMHGIRSATALRSGPAERASEELTIVTGEMAAAMTEGELQRLFTKCNHRVHFCEVFLPEVRAKIVAALQGLGRVVGYLGRGDGDALAMMVADLSLAFSDSPHWADVRLDDHSYGSFMEALEFVRSHAPSNLQRAKRLADLKRYLVVADEEIPAPFRSSVDHQIRFLEQLAEGRDATKRVKLMIVGRHAAGKTSLVKKFIGKEQWNATSAEVEALEPTHGRGKGEKGTSSASGRLKSKIKGGQGSGDKRRNGITDGIAMHVWNIRRDISLNIFDFAGQELFYSTHQFFLDQQSLYLLIFNLTLPLQQCRLSYWLNSIQSRAPGSTVIIVGTHADKIKGKERRDEYLQNKSNDLLMLIRQWRISFPGTEKLLTFVPHSSWTFHPVGKSNGVAQLRDAIAKYCDEELPARPVPSSYMKLLRTVRWKTSGSLCPVISWQQYRNWAMDIGFESDEDLLDCTRLLHSWAELMFFPNDWRLSSFVFLDPKFLAKAFRTVVSIRYNRECNFTVLKSELLERWRMERYPPQLHQPLLHLLEHQFQVIVRTSQQACELLSSTELHAQLLGEEDVSSEPTHEAAADVEFLIPCLLPDERPPHPQWDGFVSHGQGLAKARAGSEGSKPQLSFLSRIPRAPSSQAQKKAEGTILSGTSLGSSDVSRSATKKRSNSLTEPRRSVLSGSSPGLSSQRQKPERWPSLESNTLSGSSTDEGEDTVDLCFREYHLPFVPHGLQSRLLVRLFLRQAMEQWCVTGFWQSGVYVALAPEEGHEEAGSTLAMVDTTEPLENDFAQVVTLSCKGPRNHLLLGYLHLLFQQLLYDWYPGIANSERFCVMVGALMASGATVYHSRDECLQSYLFNADRQLAFQRDDALMFRLLPELMLPISSVDANLASVRRSVGDCHRANMTFEDLLNSREKYSQEVKPIRFLGEGGFGSVHLAEWFGRDVAVKRAKIDPSNLGLIDDFIKEISMLIKLQHPCIVRIFYYYPQPPCIVMEYFSKGDLEKVLASPDIALNWRQAVKIALDIASAVDYMHSRTPPVLHCDLRSPNVLVVDLKASAKDVAVKVADVGNTRIADSQGLGGGGFSMQTDVESFGMLLDELIAKVRLGKESLYSDDELSNSLTRSVGSSESSSRESGSAVRRSAHSSEGANRGSCGRSGSSGSGSGSSGRPTPVRAAAATLEKLRLDISTASVTDFRTLKVRLQEAMRALILHEVVSPSGVQRQCSPAAERLDETELKSLKKSLEDRRKVSSLLQGFCEELDKAKAEGSTSHVLALLRAFCSELDQRGVAPSDVMVREVSAQLLPLLSKAISKGDVDFLWDVLNVGIVSIDLPIGTVPGKRIRCQRPPRGTNGKTLLHCAAQVGNVEAVQLLVEWGADIGSRTNVGMTALHLAAKFGHAACLQFLLKQVKAADRELLVDGSLASPAESYRARPRSVSMGDEKEPLHKAHRSPSMKPRAPARPVIARAQSPTVHVLRRSSDDTRSAPRRFSSSVDSVPPSPLSARRSTVTGPRRSTSTASVDRSRSQSIGTMSRVTSPTSSLVDTASPLFLACLQGNRLCVQLLLEHGAAWPLGEEELVEVEQSGEIIVYKMEAAPAAGGAYAPLSKDARLSACIALVCEEAAKVLLASCTAPNPPSWQKECLASFFLTCPTCIATSVQQTVQAQLEGLSKADGFNGALRLLASIGGTNLSLEQAGALIRVENSGDKPLAIVVHLNLLGDYDPVTYPVEVNPLLAKVEPGRAKKIYVSRAALDGSCRPRQAPLLVLLEVQAVERLQAGISPNDNVGSIVKRMLYYVTIRLH